MTSKTSEGRKDTSHQMETILDSFELNATLEKKRIKPLIIDVREKDLLSSIN